MIGIYLILACSASLVLISGVAMRGIADFVLELRADRVATLAARTAFIKAEEAQVALMSKQAADLHGLRQLICQSMTQVNKLHKPCTD